MDQNLCSACKNDLSNITCPPFSCGSRNVTAAYRDVVNMVGCIHFSTRRIKLETLNDENVSKLKKVLERI